MSRGALLDTMVVSELRRGRRADPAVIAWHGSLRTSAAFISVITLLEIALGIALKERKDPAAGEALRRWYESRLKPGFSGRILPVDEAVAERCALLHAARTLPGNDALLAATALVHDLRLVTRNRRDFDGIPGLELDDPWATA